VRFQRRPGDQQALTGADQAGANGRDLLRRLALPEYDFGKPLARGSIVVHSGEAEIRVWLLAQELKERLKCRLRRAAAGADLVEQGAELLAIHCDE